MKREKYLAKTIYKDTKTMDIMDEFEGYRGDTAYEELILENVFRVFTGRRQFVHFIVKRSDWGLVEGDITFTEFKKEETPFDQLIIYAKSQIEKNEPSECNGNKKYLFDKPYRFRAQNRMNRMGYGHRWNGPYDYIEGTLYGETTDYNIVGCNVTDSWWF